MYTNIIEITNVVTNLLTNTNTITNTISKIDIIGIERDWVVLGVTIFGALATAIGAGFMFQANKTSSKSVQEMKNQNEISQYINRIDLLLKYKKEIIYIKNKLDRTNKLYQEINFDELIGLIKLLDEISFLIMDNPFNTKSTEAAVDKLIAPILVPVVDWIIPQLEPGILEEFNPDLYKLYKELKPRFDPKEEGYDKLVEKVKQR